MALCRDTACDLVPQGPGGSSERTLTQVAPFVAEPAAELEAPPERLGSNEPDPIPGGKPGAPPIFEIKIHPEPPEAKLAPSVRALLQEKNKDPYVKHHIFPQAFKPFFKEKGINVHDWVMILPLNEHKRIHRGERGGPWNADWNEWINLNGDNVNKTDIYRFAGEMIYRYCLAGTLTRYCIHALPQPVPKNPSILLEDEF